jgi:hypothetical protein
MTAQGLQALKDTEKFMELLRNSRRKIETLEKEEAGFLAEIESQRKRRSEGS